MNAHRTDCCHGHEGSESRGARPRRAGGGARFPRAVGGALFAALAALMPKCPMCIAAWLGVVGLSGLATRFDPRVVWLATAFALALGAGALAQRFLARNKHMPKKGNET